MGMLERGYVTVPACDCEYRNLGFMGFPNYRVGSDGSVWSRFRRGGRQKWTIGEWQIIKGRKTGHGYVKVQLRGEVYLGRFFVHRLVLQAFVGPCPDGMEGCHNDNDHGNNALANLRWDTHAANCRDMVKQGVSSRGGSHGRSGMAKLDDAAVLRIRKLRKSGHTCREIAKMFGMHGSQISRICNGQAWWYVTKTS